VHIVLYEPEIPGNTGNVIRLCANAGATLHLVKPLGFRLDDKHLKRSGLDYRDLATVRVHEHIDACLAMLAGSRLFAVETGGARRYSDAAFGPGAVCIFGPETRGLPAGILDRVAPGDTLCIPMRAGNRSLNLGNAVSIVVYEAWRQRDFSPFPPASRGP
jgi:tRNA (cytidine/uridine-2'-O-)-methyltransferase